MNSRTILRDGNCIAVAGALIFLTMLSACGGATTDVGNSNGAAANKPAENNASQLSSVSPTPAANSARQMDKSMPDKSKPDETVSPAPLRTRNNAGTEVASAPKPQIGSGGNDFFQFTQARAAITADPDLKTTNIVIDVKGAVVTLSGTVGSAVQKSRAEQLVRAVGGIKKVNNRIQIKNS